MQGPPATPFTHTVKGIWERDNFIMGRQGLFTLREPKYAIQNEVGFLLPLPLARHKIFYLMAKKSNNHKNGCNGQKSFSPWLCLHPQTQADAWAANNDRSSLNKISSLKYDFILVLVMCNFLLLTEMCGFLLQECVQSSPGLMDDHSARSFSPAKKPPKFFCAWTQVW